MRVMRVTLRVVDSEGYNEVFELGLGMLELGLELGLG